MTPEPQVAVIGARGVGANHVAALREVAGVRVGMIVGSTPTTAERVARALDVPRWSADWNDAVETDRISAVHICTPNNLHYPIAAAALAAGKHVICEKPLTAEVEEAGHLVELARKYSDQLSVLGYKYRYAPLLQVLREYVGGGELGRVHEIRASYLQNWMLEPEQHGWRHDTRQGGAHRVLLDIGTHLLDLMETVLGQQLVTLQGQLFNASDEAIGDGAHLLARFDEGACGVAAVSQVSAAHTHQISLAVDGSSGSARWSLADVESLSVTGAGDNARLRLDGNTKHATAGRHWRRTTDPDLLLFPLFAHAYAGLTDHGPPAAHQAVPLPTFDDGLRHVELIHTV
ncbi:MAG TPA: Gfo/Idh/MocA family oxidoreductase [Jatrophihabitans sp.]|jgi:predicted dehydrogenase|nr:Gfo/Idh/MocA family oxidoreductase [Jatrophihabitans sp.]